MFLILPGFSIPNLLFSSPLLLLQDYTFDISEQVLIFLKLTLIGLEVMFPQILHLQTVNFSLMHYTKTVLALT